MNRHILQPSEAARKLHALRSGKGELSHMATVARITAAVAPIKRKREAPSTTAPTPERLAKGDLTVTVDPVDGRRYRPRKGILEHYEGKWNEEMEVAFMRLVADSKASDVTGVTVQYDSSGSSGFGSRVPGICNAVASKIDAFNRFHYVMDRLTPRARRLCDWLLLGGKSESTGAEVTLEDAGRWIFPHMRDPNSCRMLGLGAMVITGESLVRLYGAYELDARTAASIRVPQMRSVG